MILCGGRQTEIGLSGNRPLRFAFIVVVKKQKNLPTEHQKTSRSIFLTHTLGSDSKTPSTNFRVRGGRVVEIWVIENFDP